MIHAPILQHSNVENKIQNDWSKQNLGKLQCDGGKTSQHRD